MHEDRAAVTARAGPVVIAKLDNEVIKLIVAPHRLRTGRVGQPHRAIIVAVERCVAPAIVTLDNAWLQPGARPGDTVVPVPERSQAPSAERRRAIPLAFCRTKRGSAEGAIEPPCAKNQYALMR